MAKEITSRKENYSQWYNDLVIKADLVRNSAVRGLYGNQTLWLCNLGKNAA
jgi:prolyl-tRNA synthetase